MFSKTRVTDPGQQNDPRPTPPAEAPARTPEAPPAPAAAPRNPRTPSVLSADLTVTGNISTEGDVQIEGEVEGDIRAHHLTVGQSAHIRGEVIAEEIIVNGHVDGRVRGLKVRLSSTARVEGDIIHKTIAIEAGAHFEGSVQRQENPLGDDKPRLAPPQGNKPAEDKKPKDA